MNKLECPLCRQQYQKPHMCPHCSKVYCYQCIRVYLDQYYFCPSCDKHVIDLIDCSRLINQVKEKIKQSDIRQNNQLSTEFLSMCVQHSLPQKYYCLTCQVQICSDCGLISQKHKTHTIQPIQQIKPAKNMLTTRQLNQIFYRISQKLSSSKQQQKRYLLQMQLLKSQIKYNKTKIYEYYEELILRLEKQSRILIRQIQERINQCNSQIKEKQKIKQKLDAFVKLDQRKAAESNLKIYSTNNYINVGKTNTSTKIISIPSIKSLNPKSTNKISQKQQQQIDQQLITINDKQLYKYLQENNYLEFGKGFQIKAENSYKRGKKVGCQGRSKQGRLGDRANQKAIQKEEGKQQPMFYTKSSKKTQQKHKIQTNTYLNYQNPSQLNSFSPSSNKSFIFDKKIYQLSIMNEIYPEYQNFSYQFDYNMNKDHNIVYSQVFKVNGYEWRLKIYPNGNSQTIMEYLSVFLELINFFQSPQALTTNVSKQYYFRLELLNLNEAGKSIIKEYKSSFCVGQCWGYAQFIPIKQISNYLQDGKLLFIMGIKNLNYFDLCQNMKKYICKLEGQTKILSQLCENYYLGTNNNILSNIDQINHHQLQHQLSINSNSQISYDNIEVDTMILGGNNLTGVGRNHNEDSQNVNNQSELSSIISSFHEESPYI